LFQVTVQHVIGFFGKPEDRTRNFSYFAIGMSISGLCGPIIAGFGIDYIGPTRTFLLVSALPLIPLAVVAMNKLQLPQVPRAGEAPGKRKVIDLFRDRRMRWVFAVTTLLAMAWDLYAFVMPIYGTQIGLSPSRIGLIMGTFSIATFSIRLALPWIVRQMSPWAMLSAALLVAAAMFAVFPFISSFALLAAVSFALGLGLGSSQPTVMSLLHNSAPPGRAGEAVGMRATVINFSQTSLPLLFGALGTAVGIGPVFWIMAASLVWGGIVARRRAREEQTASGG
jgi:predicted MFS family arabinose efflux permease